MDQPIVTPADLYERDEHAWIAAQIAALREGRLDDLDRDNLIDFLDAMARRERRELRSRLAVLLQHLLKLRLQPERLSRSWIDTILEQQDQIRMFLDDSLSLARDAEAFLRDAYPLAVRRAANETGLDETAFPRTCPFTMAEILAFQPPPAPPNPFKPAKPRR